MALVPLRLTTHHPEGDHVMEQTAFRPSKRSVLLELAFPSVVEIWCRPAKTVGGGTVSCCWTRWNPPVSGVFVSKRPGLSQEPGSQAQVN